MKQMKIALLAVGVLLVAGCGENKNASNQKALDAKVGGMQVETNQDGAKMIVSIADAMKSGKEMKCTYKVKDNEGEMEVVTFVNGQKYKTDMKVAGKLQHMVFSDSAMYSWSDGDKQGMLIEGDCYGDEEGGEEESDSDEVAEMDLSFDDPFEGAMSVKCEETKEADFSVPSDVEFIDQCEIMKGMMNNLPAGMPQIQMP